MATATDGTQSRPAAGERLLPYLSVAERVQRGRAARAEVPRASHAVFTPPPGRADPLAVLESQASTRVPELVPIRYGRMLVSPFTFYRGAAMIMAADLADTPRTGLMAQCCGDAHLSNFGVFASPERRLVFDLNDFDETLRGPWEWDVKRLTASMRIAAINNGYTVKDQDEIVLTTAESYRTAIRAFAGESNLEVWYAHLDIEITLQEIRSHLRPKTVRRTEKALAKARTRDSMSAFAKLTEVIDDEVRIADLSPLVVPYKQLSSEEEVERIFGGLRALLHAYTSTLEPHRRDLLEQFRLVDAARKVVGVGSVGTRAWIALLLGRDAQDPLFLQIKEAEASVFEPYLGPSPYATHGERVVVGQRTMQANSDIFLGWLHIPHALDGQERDYYVRQLRDWKGSAEVEAMPPVGMVEYGKLCAWTLARAHARSSDRIAIASYLGAGASFDRAIVEFSGAYADQNERDFRRLTKAVKSGEIVAQTGL
ncbi:MAG TPA: DUF2252 domain-containing protein [Solirubrobacteraceae bacterium]|nr:DUF2252 domain-containing protein [Solirubrobacteraceae bacterium]